MQRADELECFKTEISLVEYAAAQGYEIDRRESSRSSIVMRRGGDKIIVATDTDGHGIYFSVRDDADHGSIIDFVQRRQGLTLGQVRKELRPWLSGGVAVLQQRERMPKPAPSSADQQRVVAAWARMRSAADGHPYLEAERGISRDILADPRFASVVRIDARGNAVFPHYDRQGLVGYELKNAGFSSFSSGGQKAVWHSSNITNAPRVVLVESAIDAMSHAQLFGDREAAYLSTGGSMSDRQRLLLREIIAEASARGAEIIIATDADEAGDRMAREIAALAPPTASVRRERPDAKDWNDQLREELREEAEEARQDYRMDMDMGW